MEELVHRFNEEVNAEARRQGVNVTDALIAVNIHDVLDWAVRGAKQRIFNMRSNKKHNAELKEARELLKQFKARGKKIDFSSFDED